MIGVSRCLIGDMCTYKGSSHNVEQLKELYERGILVPVCPEVLGGLSIPRDPSEIVCFFPLKVISCNGVDVTKEYEEGAYKALEQFKKKHIKVALLKANSPSCGCDGVYDGTFSHHKIVGQGVFAKLCSENGIQLFHENQIDDFFEYIKEDVDNGTYFKD